MAALIADAAPINALDVKNALAQLSSAKGGDQNAANGLMSGPLAELAKDPLFATSLLNALGPKGMLNIPYGMAHNLSENTAPVLQFLSRTLATGTAGVNEGVGPKGTDLTVGSTYLNGLKKAGRQADSSNEPGYWSLGQILGAATTPFSTGFATNVGQDMINWDHQQNNNGNSVLGPNSGLAAGLQSDPLVGLMTALAVHGPGGSGAAGAQALFYDPGNASTSNTPPNGNLYYLIHDHQWKGDPNTSYFSDNGASLGQAIHAAATMDSSPISAIITSQAVHDLAVTYADKPGIVGSLNGTNAPITDLLTRSIGTINALSANRVAGGSASYYMPAPT